MKDSDTFRSFVGSVVDLSLVYFFFFFRDAFRFVSSSGDSFFINSDTFQFKSIPHNVQLLTDSGEKIQPKCKENFETLSESQKTFNLKHSNTELECIEHTLISDFSGVKLTE